MFRRSVQGCISAATVMLFTCVVAGFLCSCDHAEAEEVQQSACCHAEKRSNAKIPEQDCRCCESIIDCSAETVRIGAEQSLFFEWNDLHLVPRDCVVSSVEPYISFLNGGIRPYSERGSPVYILYGSLLF